MENNTLSFYNTHAQDFINNTVNVEFAGTQDKFLKYLPERGHILDFGCGSGRDTKYFIEKMNGELKLENTNPGFKVIVSIKKI